MGKKAEKSYWYQESYAAIEKAYNRATSKGASGKHLINAINAAWPWG